MCQKSVQLWLIVLLFETFYSVGFDPINVVYDFRDNQNNYKDDDDDRPDSGSCVCKV